MGTVFAAGKYLTWGVVSISVTNLVVILTMVVVFVLAMVVPFPSEDRRDRPEAPASHDRTES